ncbi:hypothetical protein [Mycoplasmopsis glycophila]|uniref:DUF3137 domain-containing protein n=1 Tax=Mycoplasmopsis glycophila TaxID=171285 RepID=A0A449AU19_9BACT|nr:hypothetical protein [Mycoplasmopsis glycophila]VEU70021.1 Uncharacterised protein [Mycoplasmopsis glycophila]
MRILKDPISLNEFYSSFKEKVEPEVKLIIKQTLNKYQATLLKSKKQSIIAWAFLGVGILSFFIFIILFWKLGINATFEYNSQSHWKWILFSLFITIILFAIFALFLFLSINKKRRIKQAIANSLNTNFVYKQAFDLFGENYNYDPWSFDENLNDSNVVHTRPISLAEAKEFRTITIPKDAKIKKYDKPIKLLLNNKYQVYFWNVLFHWYRNTDKTTTEYQAWNAFIKLSTENLEDNQFNFSLFTQKSLFSGDRQIKLENDIFNKKVRLCGYDELKARKMYTPLAQEMTVNWYTKKDKLPYNNFQIYSKRNHIYYTIKSNAGFMKLNIPFSADEHVILNGILKDIIQDVYNIYYLLEFLQLSLYLE